MSNQLVIKRVIKKKLTPYMSKKIGNEYAGFMGYQSIGKNLWLSLTGNTFSSLRIGKTLLTVPNFTKGKQLNLDEVRRVNSACKVEA